MLLTSKSAMEDDNIYYDLIFQMPLNDLAASSKLTYIPRTS